MSKEWWHTNQVNNNIKINRFNEDSPNRERNHRFYLSSDWINLRNYFIILNPLCYRCSLVNRVTPATQVHHKISLNDDWSLRLEIDNLESICDRCHLLETQREIREQRTGKKEKDYNLNIMNDLENFNEAQ